MLSVISLINQLMSILDFSNLYWIVILVQQSPTGEYIQPNCWFPIFDLKI